MRRRKERETSARITRPLEGLPVIRASVAGIDLGSERHWVCAATRDRSAREVARLWGNDRRAATHGGVAEDPAGRVGGDGKHRGLLDCSARGVRRTGVTVAAGGYPAAGKGTGAGQKDRSDRLRVDSTAAQLRLAARFVPAEGGGVHAAHAGAG